MIMKKQLLLALTLLLVASTSVAQTLNIGGHRAPLDTLNHMWLCSVPQSMFGQDFATQVNFGDELTDLVIEGVAVNNGDSVTFEAIEGGKQYVVTTQMGDSLFTGYVTFTWLPIVEMFGDFMKTYSYGTVIVSEPDSALAEPMLAKVKYRGIATNNHTKHKRNYHIKFVNEEDSAKQNIRFFGLRNDNSWLLDAGQMDFLRVRNRVSTDLWLDMANRPWYSDTLPNAHNGSRGQMVEVMLNGEYRGIYNMCEPIDRKQLKLKRYDEENKEYHGQLWMAYTWTRNVAMSEPSTDKNKNKKLWKGFEVKYPDFEEYRRSDWTVLENAVKFAKRADDSETLRTDSMGYYFDLPVMKDYFIFITTLQALDNESKNIYYACHDITEHPRLTMIPWDLDVCLGNSSAPNVRRDWKVAPERDLDWIFHLPMIDMWHMMDYHNEVVYRYRELRENVLNTDSLVNRYRSAIENLQSCGAAAREEGRWSEDSDLAGKPLNLSEEMDYVEDWLRRRMAFLDEQIFIEMTEPEPPVYKKGDVNGDGEVNVADVNTIIDIILGGSADEGTMKRADVNEDGEINIADINSELDIIMS